MTLLAALEQTLPRLRAEAEALMLDEFELGDYGDGWHYDEGQGKDVRDFDADFTTKGRLLTSTAPSEFEVGERSGVAVSRTLHIPWVDGQTVPTGKVARRASDGTEYRVLADVSHGSHPKSRRLAVEQIL